MKCDFAKFTFQANWLFSIFWQLLCVFDWRYQSSVWIRLAISIKCVDSIWRYQSSVWKLSVVGCYLYLFSLALKFGVSIFWKNKKTMWNFLFILVIFWGLRFCACIFFPRILFDGFGVINFLETPFFERTKKILSACHFSHARFLTNLVL